MKILIQNGLLIDPANGVQSQLNLLLENGKVAEITTQIPSADTIIDATGRVIAPGFVDIHMHEDPVVDGKIQFSIFNSMLRMGVTTAVGGNCGDNLYDPISYLHMVDTAGAPVNVMLFAGHEYYRRQSGAKDKYAPVTEPQLITMKNSISEALKAGCVGISYGLRYVPGTDRREFLETASCCKVHGGLLAAHVRDDGEMVFEAVEEVVEAAREFHIPVQISHIGSMGGFGQMQQLLQQIAVYRSQGLDVTSDCYPYFAFSTRIGETTYDDGWLERYHCDYSACELADGIYKGQRCTPEIFAELRRDSPDCLTVCYVMQEKDVRMALYDPGVMLGSDGIMDQGKGHPRGAGAFPRFLAEFVRNGKLSLYEGITKVTTMPAQRLGLTAKGRLNVGADADIVIFDPETIVDRATFAHPTLPPLGIDYVLVAGQIAVQNGEILKDNCGRAIFRKNAN